ncbi:hypothetical protein ABZ885_41890, partial [Kitasatospora sp. NPDC047058]
LAAIETPDDRTVVFHFPQPQADVLTAVVAARCRPRTVVGIDRSERFARSARDAAPDRTGSAS